MIITPDGIAFRDAVYYHTREFANYFSNKDRLSITVVIYPPDARRRDVDNVCKALFDSLQYSNVFKDDSQIDRLTITRAAMDKKNPRAELSLCRYSDDPQLSKIVNMV